MNRRKRLGEILLEAGVIDEFQLSKGLTDQRRWGNRLGTSLIRLGFIDESTLTRCLSKQYGLPGVNLDRIVPDREALRTLSGEIARKRLALPISFARSADGRTMLRVALGDPQNLESLDEIRFATNYPLQVLLASDHAILRAIDKYYFGQKQEDSPADRSMDTPAIHAEEGAGEMIIIRGAREELAECERMSPDAGPSPSAIADAPEVDEPEPAPPPLYRGSAAGAEALVYLKALVRLLARKKLISLDELRGELRRR